MKQVLATRDGDQFTLTADPRNEITIYDPDNSVEFFVSRLQRGPNTIGSLEDQANADNVSYGSVDDLVSLINQLNQLGLVKSGDDGRYLTSHGGRYSSVWRHLEQYASLNTTADSIIDHLRTSRVLVLGVGGFGSGVLQDLIGLGVGSYVVADFDSVEPKNAARQFVFMHNDIGSSKVDVVRSWVKDYDPMVSIHTACRRIDSYAAVETLISESSPDLLVHAADYPFELMGWVNEACVKVGVPYVMGGIDVSRGMVASVVPGISACWSCAASDPNSPELTTLDRFRAASSENRGVGPTVSMVRGVASQECLAILGTPFGLEPLLAGGLGVFDFRNLSLERTFVERNPGCTICG